MENTEQSRKLGKKKRTYQDLKEAIKKYQTKNREAINEWKRN